jgi:hypothetical protein
MKKYLSITGVLSSMFMLMMLTTGCKKEKVAPDLRPTLTAVTTLNNRTSGLNNVNYGEWIMLKGTNLATTFKVDFNSVLAADSLIYADDTSVTVKIPSVLPDPSQNPITVTTKYGTATLNFKILQPPPIITSFDPMAGPSGQTVTIVGNHFGGVTEVRFGNTPATIVSSKKDEIKVTVPPGITWAFITVTTASGSVTSSIAYGFSFVIYDDALATGWSNTSFSATAVLNNTSPVRRGVNSIKNTCTNTFGALRLTKASPAIPMTSYTFVKFSIYVTPGSVGRRVKVMLNGQSASGPTLTLPNQEGWVEYQIPKTSLGNPATLTSITFQEFSGLRQEFFVDDIGLL